MRLLFLTLTITLSVTACSSESRDRLWQTLDPAGYKHSHSKVFNPQKYRQESPPDRMTEQEMAEFDLSQ